MCVFRENGAALEASAGTDVRIPQARRPPERRGAYSLRTALPGFRATTIVRGLETSACADVRIPRARRPPERRCAYSLRTALPSGPRDAASGTAALRMSGAEIRQIVEDFECVQCLRGSSPATAVYTAVYSALYVSLCGLTRPVGQA